jgi:hypothetical protein
MRTGDPMSTPRNAHGAHSWLSRNMSNIIAGVALLVSVIGTVAGYSIAEKSFNLSVEANKKADSNTVDGGFLDPPKLSDALCYRFHGYQRNLIGSQSLWIAIHAVGDSSLHVTKVDSKYLAAEFDTQAAMRENPNAHAWVMPVQIGDDRSAENSVEYAVDLFYADSAQATELTKGSSNKFDALPAGVESHHLGTTLSLTHPPHAAVNGFACSLDNAR